MGLLDLDSDTLLSGLLSAGAASGAKGNYLSRVAQGLAAGERFKAGRAEQARQRSQDEMQAEYRQLMMRKMQMEAERDQRGMQEQDSMRNLARQFMIPGTPASAGTPANEMDSGMDVGAVAAKPAGYDFAGYANALSAINPVAGFEMQQKLVKDKPKPITVAEGARVFDPATKTELFSNPKVDKPASVPTSLQEYKAAQDQGYKGSFMDYQTALRKSGATQIGMPRIDIKMGDSVAGQIGPMAKDSRTQAQGAVKMFDAADRIDAALKSGMVSAGPGTTQIQTVKQLIQKVGGGNDEGIRQTRQVIKSLAQMAVEARKQLAGQGQVTESEAAAVAKADAGDINDLTTGELQDLVTLTRRAAHYSAKGHQEILDSMSTNDGTKGGVPFYKVQGMDRLLKYEPTLPQIGGTSNVDSLVDKYRSKK